MRKMIDAQSIVVASMATNQHGSEGSILRYVFFHSLALAVLVGLLVLSQAYVFPGVMPWWLNASNTKAVNLFADGLSGDRAMANAS